MDRWIFEFINEWKQLIGSWNWYTFTFINIEIENDLFTHGVEFLFIVLGFGFRIRYNKPSFDKWAKDLMKETDEAKELWKEGKMD